MLKIKGWSQAHDESDITVIGTLTRCQDPTNNSNKYRRFISVWAPGERPYVFTHTGRWTVECDSGFWNNVGTYRPGELVRATAWSRACRLAGTTPHPGAPAAHMFAHEAQVQRKLGEYKVTESSQFLQITNANVQAWLRKADVVETNTHGAATPVPTPTTPIVQPMAAKPAPTRVSDSSHIMVRVQNALQRSVAEGADPFDVMADVATLRAEVTSQITELQGLASDLSLANTNAMERI